VPPNIVWIMTDQHRRDCVGAYSDRPVQTPNLDRLAERSVVFDRHYSTCPLCVPARSSLHTGRFSHSCGAVINGFSGGDYEASLLNDDEVTVAELMADAGYHVGHIGVDHVRARRPVRDRGCLADYVSNADHRRHIEERGLSLPDLSAHQHPCPTRFGDAVRMVRFSAPNPGRHPFAPEDYLDVFFAERGARFIEEAPSDRPFFLMCFLWLPHPPFVIPEPYRSMYSPLDVELPTNIPGTQDGKPRMHLSHLPGQVGAGRAIDAWRETWAAYYGCVTLVDECIGRVLDAVAARGADDETAVIFHPDHGEMLGAHGYFQKMVCYEESIRLPLLVSAPGADAGRRDCLTSHIDIMPTILELGGVSAPDRVQGRSLLPVARDSSTTHWDALFSEYNGNVVRDTFQRCVVSGDHKYIRNHGDIDELYNLREDPHEMRNIAAEPSARSMRDELRSRLAQWMAETGDFIELA